MSLVTSLVISVLVNCAYHIFIQKIWQQQDTVTIVSWSYMDRVIIRNEQIRKSMSMPFQNPKNRPGQQGTSYKSKCNVRRPQMSGSQLHYANQTENCNHKSQVIDKVIFLPLSLHFDSILVQNKLGTQYLYTLMVSQPEKLLSSKPGKSNSINLRIISLSQAYFKTVSKILVPFQKDRHKTVGEIADIRYTLPRHLDSILSLKSSKYGKK